MAKLKRTLPAAGLAVVMLGGGWAAWQASSGRPGPPPRPAPPGEAGRPVPELVGIEPGAVVDAGPPPGWTHRVVRSTMELDSGEVETLPGFARRTAEMFRTVILAEVGPDGRGAPALRRVGVGLALEHEGRDRAVTPDSLDRVGVSLSLFDKMVLGRAEAAVERGRLAARTPTFALYDASLEMIFDGAQQSVFLRYALLVEPGGGDLRAIAWPVAEDPARRSPPAELILLPPGLEFACRIRVAVSRGPGGLPLAWKFALTNLPPGRTLPMPEALREWSTRDPADAAESARMEALVREALAALEAG